MPAHAAHKLALLRPYTLRPGVHFDYGLEPPFLRVPRSTLSPANWRCLILLGMALPACVAALAPRRALAVARRPCALLFALSAGLLFLVEDKSAYNNHDWLFVLVALALACCGGSDRGSASRRGFGDGGRGCGDDGSSSDSGSVRDSGGGSGNSDGCSGSGIGIDSGKGSNSGSGSGGGGGEAMAPTTLRTAALTTLASLLATQLPPLAAIAWLSWRSTTREGIAGWVAPPAVAVLWWHARRMEQQGPSAAKGGQPHHTVVGGEAEPRWNIWFLRCIFLAVYVFAGVAKLDDDWIRGHTWRELLRVLQHRHAECARHAARAGGTVVGGATVAGAAGGAVGAEAGLATGVGAVFFGRFFSRMPSPGCTLLHFLPSTTFSSHGTASGAAAAEALALVSMLLDLVMAPLLLLLAVSSEGSGKGSVNGSGASGGKGCCATRRGLPSAAAHVVGYAAMTSLCVFHLVNHLLFRLGVFPWVCLAAMVLFLDPARDSGGWEDRDKGGGEEGVLRGVTEALIKPCRGKTKTGGSYHSKQSATDGATTTTATTYGATRGLCIPRRSTTLLRRALRTANCLLPVCGACFVLTLQIAPPIVCMAPGAVRTVAAWLNIPSPLLPTYCLLDNNDNNDNNNHHHYTYNTSGFVDLTWEGRPCQHFNWRMMTRGVQVRSSFILNV